MVLTDRAFLMENHDEAYRIWRDAGVTHRTLIHVDAHHDMWWIPDGGATTIANYICRALKEGLVGKVYWVVPDATWDTSETRRPVMRHLKRIARTYSGASGRFRITPSQIETEVLGRPLVVCPIGSLPRLDEDVLLDIDTDYLVLTHVTHGESDARRALPWCWPEKLLERLRDLNLRSSLVTVAYSVEGGYTPLKWKYLGDELAARLRNSGVDSQMSAAINAMREAAGAASRGELKFAEDGYREATTLYPDWAPPYYHLAGLYAAAGRIADAQRCYRQSLGFDSSYRLEVESAGLLYQADGRYERAEFELTAINQLDPNDPYALFGLARIAAKKKRWSETERMLRTSLAVNNRSIDAHRALGDLLARQGRRGEAIVAYQQALKLGLSGAKPLLGPIATNSDDDSRMTDSDHCRTYARLADLYASSGDADRAINAYRLSIHGGYDRASSRVRLAVLYGRKRQWRKSAREVWGAIACLPPAATRSLRRAQRRASTARARLSRSRATNSG